MVLGIPRTYDPQRVIFTVGPVIITGIQEGSEIVFEPKTPEKYDVIGAIDSLDTVRTRKRMNHQGVIRCPLISGTAGNAYFQSLSNSDDLTGAGYLPFALKNTIDGSITWGNLFVNNFVPVRKSTNANASVYEWLLAVTQVRQEIRNLNLIS